MAHRRADVVRTALDVLDRYGLADLSMRRLAGELDVQPSALYHHFANKQLLLAALADEVLRRGRRESRARSWRRRVEACCRELRDAMLAYRDGAELVATVRGFGLGGDAPYDDLLAALAGAELPAATRATAAATLIHYVLGHTLHEQTHLQAHSAGAIEGEPDRSSADFEVGLGLVLDGVAARESARVSG